MPRVLHSFTVPLFLSPLPLPRLHCYRDARRNWNWRPRDISLRRTFFELSDIHICVCVYVCVCLKRSEIFRFGGRDISNLSTAFRARIWIHFKNPNIWFNLPRYNALRFIAISVNLYCRRKFVQCFLVVRFNNNFVKFSCWLHKWLVHIINTFSAINMKSVRQIKCRSYLRKKCTYVIFLIPKRTMPIIPSYTRATSTSQTTPNEPVSFSLHPQHLYTVTIDRWFGHTFAKAKWKLLETIYLSRRERILETSCGE